MVRVSDRRVAFLADRYKGAAGTAEVGRWLLRAVLEISSRRARSGFHIAADGHSFWEGKRLPGSHENRPQREAKTYVIPRFIPTPKVRRSAKGRVLKSKV